MNTLNTAQLDMLAQLCGVEITPSMFNTTVCIKCWSKGVVLYRLSRMCPNNHEAIISAIEQMKGVG